MEVEAISLQHQQVHNDRQETLWFDGPFKGMRDTWSVQDDPWHLMLSGCLGCLRICLCFFSSVKSLLERSAAQHTLAANVWVFVKDSDARDAIATDVAV